MYIDKSFQLLSADSGKATTDETRRQNAGDDDAEFSELLGAELNQHEQQKEAENAAGSDKKSGQEVAALLAKQAKTAEQINAEKSLADKAKAAVTGANEATDSVGNTDKAADSSGEALDVAAGASNGAISQAGAKTGPDAVADLDAEQVASSDPWLEIISQSHDFNQILSQSSQQPTAATHDTAFTFAETLLTELVGLPVTDQTATGTEPAVAIAGQATETTKTADSSPNNQKPAAGKELAGVGDTSKTLSDTTLLSIAAGQPDDAARIAAANSAVVSNTGGSDNTSGSKPTKFPAEPMTVRELLKADQLTRGAATGEYDIDAANITTEQQTNSGAVPVGQATLLQVSAETVAGQLNQADGKAAKNLATTPIDIELPIEVSPDIKALNTAVTESTTAAPSAKNAPQSFAQFQKTANAAAALVQKQQLQAEQTQQPLQDSAGQQPQKFADLIQSVTGSHTETPVAFNSLLQTDRPISGSGGAMGSSTGQQQQQAASQLFATKLSDSVHHSEQPALNLLEPNAATQLKERVMFQVNQKIHSAEIKLAPEELGSMQIKVQLQQEQLSVQFVVQQAGAKEALEQQMPRLREMLEEQGIELKDGQVSQQREGSDEQRQARERNQVLGNGADMDEKPLQQQAMIRVSDRMVDYYA